MALLRDLYKKAIRLSDFNGDNAQDFFIRFIQSPPSFLGSAGVLGNGFAGYLDSPLVPIGSPDSSNFGWRLLSASFNGDNRTDVFYYNRETGQKAINLVGQDVSGPNSTRILAGAFLPSTPTGVNSDDWQFSLLYDLDGDKKSDLFWANDKTGQIAIWTISETTITGGAIFTASPTGTDPSQWKPQPYTDFNGDGSNDIFWSNSSTGQKAVWLMSGAQIVGGGFLPSSPNGINPTQWRASVACDFNGDRKTDIAWTNIHTGQKALWLMDGTTIIGGSFLQSSPTGANPNQWLASFTFDFNGDRKSDVFWTNLTTGQKAIWTMDGTTITGGAILPSSPTGTNPGHWDSESLADFNGDGKDDIFWRNTTTNQSAIWLMDGASIIGGGFLPAGNPTGILSEIDWVPFLVDINGDNKTDIYWGKASNLTRAAIWIMDGIEVISGRMLPTSTPGNNTLILSTGPLGLVNLGSDSTLLNAAATRTSIF